MSWCFYVYDGKKKIGEYELQTYEEAREFQIMHLRKGHKAGKIFKRSHRWR